MRDNHNGWAPADSRYRPMTAIAAAALALSMISDAGTQTALAVEPGNGPQDAAPRAQAKKPAVQPPGAAHSPANGQPQPAGASEPQFIFSPWTKICGKDGPEGSNAKDVCAVLTEARVESGQIAASASLVESKDGTQKILRITMPLGVRLPYGTRVIIDQGAALQGAYLMCLAGCFSDYEANADMIDKLKKGQTLTIQAINPGGYQVSMNVPLLDFAKAYEGPPTDQKVLLEREKKLQEQLQRRADESRKRLEGQQPEAAPSGTAIVAPPSK
jgi:invasion protein IalB